MVERMKGSARGPTSRTSNRVTPPDSDRTSTGSRKDGETKGMSTRGSKNPAGRPGESPRLAVTQVERRPIAKRCSNSPTEKPVRSKESLGQTEQQKKKPTITDAAKKGNAAIEGAVALYQFNSMPFQRWAKHATVEKAAAQYAKLKAEEDAVGLTTHTSDLDSNRTRNRYFDVKAWDQTRVILHRRKERGKNDYINANYVDAYWTKNGYILTQGPKDNTIDDFWEMVWQENATLIVMLCQTEEMGKTKCAQYWPRRKEAGGRMETEGFALWTQSERPYLPDIFGGTVTVTWIQVAQKHSDETRVLAHLQYRGWPDFGVPQEHNFVPRFWKEARKMEENVWKTRHMSRIATPIIVHCSAGIGRSGTFVAIDICTEALRHRGKIEVEPIVRQIKTQRRGSVQTPGQYIYIYICALMYIQERTHAYQPIPEWFAKAQAYQR